MFPNLIKESKNTVPFETFFEEIDVHFKYVITQKLRWNIKDIFISRGNNNIVIKFHFDTNEFIFRVPIYGPHQILAVLKAEKILRGADFFNPIIYADNKCVIEALAKGNKLGVQPQSDDYSALASALEGLHAHKGSGFGWLLDDIKGSEKSVDDYVEQHVSAYWLLLEQSGLLSPLAIEKLRLFSDSCIEKLNAKDKVLCHGDVWESNVFFDQEHQKISLIDWESIGIYTCEKDLTFLVERNLTDRQKKIFIESYRLDFDEALIHWYVINNIVSCIFGSRQKRDLKHLIRLSTALNRVAHFLDDDPYVTHSNDELEILSQKVWKDNSVEN